MNRTRQADIGYQLFRITIRKKLGFRDIRDIKRRIGNLVKEKEMVNISATKEELLLLAISAMRAVFEEEMKHLTEDLQEKAR